MAAAFELLGRYPTADEGDGAASRAAAGGRRVDTLRRMLARKAAELIRSDQVEAEAALELGLIDHRWLDDPMNAVQLLAAHRTPPTGETRMVTVAFTDLEGFTSYTDVGRRS